MTSRATHRPTPKQLGNFFKRKTHCDPPPASKIYTCDTPSPVDAVPEFAPMGGVLISYPGTVAQSVTTSQSGPLDQSNLHVQLPAGGPRAFGIPDELIIRMQQADTNQPVHIFILCADQNQQARITANLSETAKSKGLTFD